MAEALGRGVIEIVGDARKLRASIEEAKKSIRTLGEGQKDVSASASRSIDQYIGKLQQQNQTIGKSARETELFKLAMRGASNEQLRSADAALRISEANAKNARNMEQMRTSAARLGAVIGTVLVAGLIAAAVAFDKLVNQAADFKDLAEKTGGTAEGFASLAVAAKVGGVAMEELGGASIKLTKNLTGVDDESEDAGAAIKALGLNIADFKKLKPEDQIEAIAKAMAGFEDGAGKTAIALALFGKAGAQMLPFLKELAGDTGRQNILSQEQIDLADDYIDRQKRLTAQLGLHAQAIAVQMLPALNDLTGAFVDVIKETFNLGKAGDDLAANKAIGVFADNAIRAFAFVVDAADGVIRIVQIVGKNFEALANIQKKAFSGDFSGAIAEQKKFVQDAQDILNRPTLGKAVEARIEARRAKEQFVGPPERPAGTGTRPTIQFSGRTGSGSKGQKDNTAEQEAKAQLAADLDQIKKSGDAQIAEFDRAQRIMEARRSAALVDDKDYFTAKLGFIELNLKAQEKAIEAEIALLQKQSFTGKTAGKEKIDNDRKIADATARLSKVRADAVAEIEINSIQEAAALKRTEVALRDAKDASDAYIDSIQRRNAAEIAGLGAGNKAREEQAGALEIEARLRQRRQQLESELRRGQISEETFNIYLTQAEETYRQEVELYQQRTEAIKKAEGDWRVGALEALNNYADETMNVAKRTEQVWTNAFKGAEDALTKFLDTGKLDFKDFIKQITSDLNRSFVQQSITGPLANMMKGAVGGAGSGGGGLFGGLFEKLGGLVGSFDTGTAFVPRTGLALVHKGEKITPASQNTGATVPGVTIVQQFAPGTNSQTVNQAAAASGRAVRRELARGTSG